MKTIEDTADSTDEAHRLATAMWDALADPLTETTMPTLLSAAERFLSTVHTYDTLALSRAYRAAADAIVELAFDDMLRREPFAIEKLGKYQRALSAWPRSSRGGNGRTTSNPLREP